MKFGQYWHSSGWKIKINLNPSQVRKQMLLPVAPSQFLSIEGRQLVLCLCVTQVNNDYIIIIQSLGMGFGQQPQQLSSAGNETNKIHM